MNILRYYSKPMFFVMILIICLSFNPRTGLAAPYAGDVFVLRQPDGSKVKVKVWGDEFYQRIESLDGYTLIRDKNTGWICYAELNEDESDFISTGIIYEDSASKRKRAEKSLADKKLKKHLKLPKDIILQKREKKRKDLNIGISPDDMVISVDKSSNTFLQYAPLTGSVLGLTLLIDFPDEASSISQAEIGNYCNQWGYTGYGCNGSVRDYFYDVSGEQVDYTNHVTSFYTADNNKAYYTDSNIAYGVRACELIHEALDHLENVVGFDFSTLSTDSSNCILAINAFYAGDPDSGWAEGLWPHKGYLSPVFSADGVKSKFYQITNIGTNLDLRTFCHENGHMLFEWPDLYDYGYDSTGIGDFGIMAYGGNNDNPVPPCAFLRDMASWETIIDITNEPLGSAFNHTANSLTTYRYSHPTDSDEYFLIESRTQNGRNTFIPDEGLVIWHIDKNGSNNYQQMTCAQHYLVSIEQADGLFQLENNTNYGGAGDLFHAGYKNKFTDGMVPNSDWWCDGISDLIITDISAVDSEMSFTLGFGTQAYYSFSEGSGTTTVDDTGNGFDGTIYGGATWTEGRLGNGLSFDGQNDYVNIPSLSRIAINEISVEAWVNFSGTRRYANIVDKGCNDIENFYMQTGSWNTQMNFGICFTNGSKHASGYSPSVSTGEWHHYVGTWDGTYIRLYLDGILVSVSSDYSGLTMEDTLHSLTIGKRNSSSLYYEHFLGKIDEVHIYDHTLSAEEVEKRYYSPSVSYNFSEGEGTTTTDGSGNGNDGTIYGATWTEGKVGNGLSFDGQNDYVIADNVLSMDTNEVSVEAWVNFSGIRRYACIVDKGRNDNENFYMLCGEWNTQVNFSLCFNDGSKHGSGSSPSVSTGEWHHYVGTWDGSYIKLYMDGNIVSTSADYSSLTMKDTNHSLTVGKRNWPAPPYYEHFWGKIDQVRIYNRALNEDDVKNRFNSVSAAYYTFSEGEGTMTADESGNGNDGTINGATWTEGRVGNGLSFDGQNDYVGVDSLPGMGTNGVSVEAWVNFSGTRRYANIVDKGRNDIENFYLQSGSWNTQLNFGICFTDGSRHGSGYSSSVSTGEWHHYVGTWDGSYIRLYMDGNSVSTSANYSGLTMEDTTHSFTIGKRNSTAPPYYEHFLGKIDQVRIYDRALTDEEVLDKYNNTP